MSSTGAHEGVPRKVAGLQMSPPLVVACMKLVELGAAVDPLTGHVLSDPLSAGPSPADQAALEWALRIGEMWGAEVVAVSAGDPRCEKMLRGALAAGATRALRIALDSDQPSAAVAGAVGAGLKMLLAGPSREQTPDLLVTDAAVRPVVVCCGDASLDRGSGSFPAFLAGELRAAQALGLVAVDPGPVLEVERRLGRGRRERLRLVPPCVISVEATTARLRRASLPGLLAARSATVEVIDGVSRPDPSGLHVAADPTVPGVGPDPSGPLDGGVGAGSLGAVAHTGVELLGVEPFRPRTRVVSPPSGTTARERILDLTGVFRERRGAKVVVLEAEAAAAELLSALSEWIGQPSLSPDGSSPRNGG